MMNLYSILLYIIIFKLPCWLSLVLYVVVEEKQVIWTWEVMASVYYRK